MISIAASTLAQAMGAPEWIGNLSAAGIACIFAWWLMNRVEARLKAGEDRMVGIENASNRTSRAILMLVMSLNRHHDGEAARAEARKIADEIDESERERDAVRKKA